MVQYYDHVTTDIYNAFMDLFELQEYFKRHNVIYTEYSPRELKLKVEVKNVDEQTEQYIFDMIFYHLVKIFYGHIKNNSSLYIDRDKLAAVYDEDKQK